MAGLAKIGEKIKGKGHMPVEDLVAEYVRLYNDQEEGASAKIDKKFAKVSLGA